jgi:hypothetical protein
MPVGSNWLGDDHPSTATLRAESAQGHRQATAEEAAIRGWYYRRGGIRTNPLEPDTRKCACHGLLIFEPLPLTVEEANIRHPLSPNVLRGEPA